MSKSLLESVTEIFQPQLPAWACEFTSRHFIVAGLDPRRTSVIGKAAVDAPAGGLIGSLVDRNLNSPDNVLSMVRTGLSQAGAKGSEIAVVIPDDSARISFLAADKLPSGQEERETFIRWKLKKSMPFDVDSAQVAYKILGTHGANKAVDLVVALSPRAVIEEYVDLMEKAELHAGFVIPSTLAAMNLLRTPAEDTLFVKIAPGCITTTVFQKRRFQFYRRVPEMPLYDAVYPTIMYYQDKLMGAGIERVVVCTYDDDARGPMAELQEKLNVPVGRLQPQHVGDLYKPVLGALNFTVGAVYDRAHFVDSRNSARS